MREEMGEGREERMEETEDLKKKRGAGEEERKGRKREGGEEEAKREGKEGETKRERKRKRIKGKGEKWKRKREGRGSSRGENVRKTKVLRAPLSRARRSGSASSPVGRSTFKLPPMTRI